MNDRSPGCGVRDVRRVADSILSIAATRPTPPHVIVLAYWPSNPNGAVTRLRLGDVPVTCVKPSFVVGTPTDRGPSDVSLRPRWGRPWVPKGTRTWVPLRIDDLARMLANAATTRRPAGETAFVGGPAPMTAAEIAKEMGVDRVLEIPSWLYRFLPGADPYLAASDSTPAARFMAGPTHFGIRPRAISAAWPDSQAGTKAGRLRTTARFGRTPAMLGTALLIVLFGLFLIAAGVHDVIAVNDIGRAIAGLVMAASGALVLGAGARLVAGGWPMRFSAAEIACLLVCLWCVVFTAMSHRAGGDYEYVGLWAVLILLSLLGAYAMHRRADVRQMLRGAPAIVTSLLVGGVLLGIVQFWYLDLYRPATAPPTLNLTPSLKVSKGRGAEPRIVTAKLSLETRAPAPSTSLGSFPT